MTFRNAIGRTRWLSPAVALAVVAVTVVLWQSLAARERKHLDRALQLEATRLDKKLSTELESQIRALSRMARRWEFWGTDLEVAWKADARQYAEHQPAYEGIVWVTPSRETRWMASTAENGTPHDFAVQAPPQARTALERARETREPVVSSAFPLAGTGAVVLVPVPVVAEDQLQGFLVPVLSLERLFDSVWSQDLARGYSIAVFENSRLLYRRLAGEQASASGATARTEAGLDRVSWEIRVRPSSDLLAAQQSRLPATVLGAGLLTALLMGLIIVFVQRSLLRADEAEAARQGLEEEVGQRQRAEDKLRRLNETLEQRVAERTREAEAANRAKSLFLANMSHEIRTPLNAVLGMTDLILDTRLSAEQREYATMARESGESLLTIINDVLDFSKIEAGRLELEPRTFDHAELLGDAMKSLGPRAHGKGLELICAIGPDVPALLVGDPGRLRQVLVNLVGNAIKFTEAGEVVVDVRPESRTDDSVLLHYAVSDTGPGLAPEQQRAIFEAFEQGDSPASGGTGLGLAISSRLVELMGGRIWAESEPGRGSTFHFTVRFRVAAEQPATREPADVEALHELPVLVVDDNARNRRLLAELLGRWTMAPETVGSGDEALEELRRAHRTGAPYRLIMTDAHMPGIDGFALVERIQRDPELSGTVVMMLSSGDRPGERARCEELGVAACLLKPVKLSELVDAILLALGLVTGEEAERTEDEQAVPLPPLDVLLAEDSPVNQKLAVALLEKQGHRVTAVDDGHKALESLHQREFDLVLMDVQMPGIDGLEATRRLRARERQSDGHTPVIAMTAYAMKGDRERCLEAGTDDYVAKPIRSRQLFETMARVLGHADSGTPSAGAPTARDAEQAGRMVDWSSALQGVQGNRELLKSLVHAFLVEAPQLLADMREAVSQNDPQALLRAAHTLKGQLHLFGAAVAEHLALHIENAGRENRVDVAEAVEDLAGQVTQIQAEVQTFLDDCVQSGA